MIGAGPADGILDLVEGGDAQQSLIDDAHLRKAAEAGISLAAENLGYSYYRGDHGLKVNMDEAAVWLIRSMTLPGGAAVRDWLAGKPEALPDPNFWKAAHTELTRLGVYSGKIASKANSETVAALFKL